VGIFFGIRRLANLRFVLPCIALALSGCASMQPHTVPFESTTEERPCIEWLSKLDAVVDEAGVADAEATRIAGFPHLRTNRFLASFRDELDTNEKWAAWLARLNRLASERRHIEISNLPNEWLASIAADRDAALVRMNACAALLAGADLASPMRLSVLRERTTVPDSYSVSKRVMGAYAVTRVPFFAGVRQWQQRTLDAFGRAAATTPSSGDWQAYAIDTGIPEEPGRSSARQSTLRDALGIPVIDAKELAALSRLHAPIFNVESTGAYDKFGRLTVPQLRETNGDNRGGTRVDISAPAAYLRHDFTRYGKSTLLQLTYTLWFPERPADGAFDLLAGKLDGVMVRITFAPNGEIVMVDSAHACGCYHQFFPAANVTPLPAPGNIEEWAFVPASLPPVAASQRLRVWIASRTHYLVRIDAANASSTAKAFSLAANDTMLDAGTSSRSLYQPDGLVAGSERGERFLFWPMGIASAGQMRQWGHHATAFVGRRHFDDAHLIEKYFVLPANN
jgi:hypothetical protein